MTGTILITGGGSPLARALAEALAQAGFRSLTSARSAGDFPCDLRDAGACERLVESARPDCVYHLAASYSHELAEAVDVNVHAARRLLESVEKNGRYARVVLIGSSAEYGVVREEESPIAETRALSPVSVYGLTKAWQTQLASYFAGRGVDVVVARIFNLDGPGLSPRLFVGRVRQQIAEVLAGTRSTIEVGPLTAVRDYVSMPKAVRQLMSIAERGVAGTVYHVASGRPRTMRSMLEQYMSDSGLGMNIVREALQLSNRSGMDVPVIYADVTRTQELMSGSGL